MLSERLADGVRYWAPAKVNLFLEVLAKRADGFHDIATLMVAVSLFDTLEFKEESRGELRLVCDDLQLSTGPDNLVCRAAELLRRQSGCNRGARVWLQKRIPMAAGLGGGSTDGAATLLGLNELWQLGLSSEELARLAVQLGSDVAFFLSAPLAWCTGRGEVVQPETLGSGLWFVLVCPRSGLTTADVYGALKVPRHPETGSDLRRAVRDGDVIQIGRRLHNRLQPVADRLCPEVAVARRRLEAMSPAGHLLSGSGSSSFALWRNRDEAIRSALELRRGTERNQGPNVFVVRSCF